MFNKIKNYFVNKKFTNKKLYYIDNIDKIINLISKGELEYKIEGELHSYKFIYKNKIFKIYQYNDNIYKIKIKENNKIIAEYNKDEEKNETLYLFNDLCLSIKNKEMEKINKNISDFDNEELMKIILKLTNLTKQNKLDWDVDLSTYRTQYYGLKFNNIDYFITYFSSENKNISFRIRKESSSCFTKRSSYIFDCDFDEPYHFIKVKGYNNDENNTYYFRLLELCETIKINVKNNIIDNLSKKEEEG